MEDRPGVSPVCSLLLPVNRSRLGFRVLQFLLIEFKLGLCFELWRQLFN